MTEKCRCSWCIGTEGSDDLSLAEKNVRINEERRKAENDPIDQERKREISLLLKDIGIIR